MNIGEHIQSFFIDFFSAPAIIMGIVGLVGLLLLRKKTSDVIVGTFKVIFGILILSAGVNVIIGALIPFSKLFTGAFKLKGAILEDNSLVASVLEKLGIETTVIMIGAFIINLLIARFTKWKYIFLTGHMMLTFAGTMAIVLSQMGLPMWGVMVIGAIVQGISQVIFPAIAQPTVRKLTGNNNVATGFWGVSLIIGSAWLSKLILWKRKDKDEGEEKEIKFSEKLNFLKNMSVLMGITMFFLYMLIGLIAWGVQGTNWMLELTGKKSPIVFLLLKSLTFTAGILILLQGVRMFLGELIPAFKGISERLIPNAIPALDIPIFYQYAPNAVNVGFILSLIGGIAGSALSLVLPVTIVPSVIGLYFMGGAAGVFGHKLAGKWGVVIAPIILGFTWTLLAALSYKLVDPTQYGAPASLWFATPDSIIVVNLIKIIGRIFGVGFVA